MPVINCKAAPADKTESNVYECPCYKHLRRGPTYAFSAPRRRRRRPQKWVLKPAQPLIMDVATRVKYVTAVAFFLAQRHGRGARGAAFARMQGMLAPIYRCGGSISTCMPGARPWASISAPWAYMWWKIRWLFARMSPHYLQMAALRPAEKG